jgi:hypothetical protein
MRSMRFAGPFVCVLLVGACSFDRSGPPNGETADAPVVVADAMTDAPPDAMLCASACAGDVLEGCNGDPDRTCDLGCSMSPSPHCKQIVPSNAVSLGELSGTTAGFETVSSATGGVRREYTIDTDSGKILDYGDDGFPANTTPTTIRSSGTGVKNGMGFDTPGSIAVLSVDSMHLAQDSVLYGFGSRPLVILSRGDVLIEGAIDFSAGCYLPSGAFDFTCGGAGGGVGAIAATGAGGCGPGGNGTTGHFTGGGGGGFAATGGQGGDFSSGNGNTGGTGGSAAGCAGATLEPLTGGGGGGNGGAGMGGDGGGGGGGIQITSETSITVSHPVTASTRSEVYAAGAGGVGTKALNQGGGGGGAGGAILLEAPAVHVNSVVTANGGGGAGGRDTGKNGAYGSHDTSQALGGAGEGGGLTGAGGAGGAFFSGAGQGLAGGDGTGGGGGSVGRIRLNTPTTNADLFGATISPSASQGMLVIQ